MRIGIDARFLGGPSYGLAQYSENLLRGLARLDEENQYTVFVGSGNVGNLELGPNFELVVVRGRPLSAKGLLRLPLAIRRAPLDLLHVHFPLVPPGIRCPTLITVHDTVPFAGRSALGTRFPFWDRIGSWFLYPATMHMAKWILCVSRATRDKLVRLFPDVFHKTIVLASGVEEVYRRPPEAATLQLLRSRLGVPQRYVFYSGSSGESKNLPRMIEAFARLRQDDSRAADVSFVLDLMGDLGGIEAIRSVAGRYGVVPDVKILTGLTDDERLALFRGARLLFIASKEEGFGFPVLKAQLGRVPVLAADAGALPEVCGDGALLVDPDNVEEMIRMLSEALFDVELREFLADKGEKNAARYSWDDTALQVRQIYELLF